MKQYYVYMLLCSDGSLYIGITNDLERRVWEHESGWAPECYTHTRRPVSLVYCAEFANVDDAIRWEKQVKGWGRAKKLALADGDWDRVKQLSRARPSTGSG